MPFTYVTYNPDYRDNNLCDKRILAITNLETWIKKWTEKMFRAILLELFLLFSKLFLTEVILLCAVRNAQCKTRESPWGKLRSRSRPNAEAWVLKSVTNICFKFSCKLVLKVQNNKLLWGIVIHLFEFSGQNCQQLHLWLQNEHRQQSCEQFAPHPGEANDSYAELICTCLKQSRKKKKKSGRFSELPIYKWEFIFLAIFLLWIVISFGSQLWTSLSFVCSPSWGANSSQDAPLVVISWS